LSDSQIAASVALKLSPAQSSTGPGVESRARGRGAEYPATRQANPIQPARRSIPTSRGPAV